MKARVKKVKRAPAVPLLSKWGLAYATAYRYGKWGRIFCVQCPFCKEFLESPFRSGSTWQLTDFILRKRIHCNICCVDLQISANYKIIKEDD